MLLRDREAEQSWQTFKVIFLRVQEHPQNEEQEGTAQMVEVEAGNRLGIGRLASCVGMRPGRPKHRWI